MTVAALVLPAYFDPLRDAAHWSRVIARADDVKLVVLNPSSGPGPDRQECYAELAGRLRAAGIQTLGYVDTGYGSRPVADVREECAAFRDWYDVDGAFLDQVSSGAASLGIYKNYVGNARSLGCRTVVLNPGVYPDRAYLDLADSVVAFEGDVEMHRSVTIPPWAMSLPAGQFCHLVYGVPEAELDDVRARVQRSNASTLYLTDGLAPNPWGALPTYWGRLAE